MLRVWRSRTRSIGNVQMLRENPKGEKPFLDKSLPFRESLCSRESLQNFVRRNNRSAHDVLAENRTDGGFYVRFKRP